MSYKILTIGGLILIGFVLVGGLIFGPFNSILPEDLRQKLGYSDDNEGTLEVQLIVDFSGFKENLNITIIFEDNETATAYSVLLQANLSVEVIDHPNGVYITSIDGISQTTEYNWWYLADGADGGLASNRFNLRTYNVKIIEWIFKQALR